MTPMRLHGASLTRRKVKDAGEILPGRRNHSWSFYTTHGISTFGMPQTSQVCKDPPKPETELFKDIRKKPDERAKGGRRESSAVILVSTT